VMKFNLCCSVPEEVVFHKVFQEKDGTDYCRRKTNTIFMSLLSDWRMQSSGFVEGELNSTRTVSKKEKDLVVSFTLRIFALFFQTNNCTNCNCYIFTYAVKDKICKNKTQPGHAMLQMEDWEDKVW